MENQIYTSKGWKRVLLFAIPWLIQLVLFQALAYILLGYDLTDLPSKLPDHETLIISLFDLTGSLILVWLFTRFIDKKDFTLVGFRKGNILRDTMAGIAIGFTIMIVALTVLVLTSQIEITSLNFTPTGFLYSAFLFTSVAVVEELVVRGYVLNNLILSFNPFVALCISSILFAAMHAGNPNLDILGVAGLLLGIGYVLTKNLWLSIALHFCWNFFQSLFGFNVSGQDFYSLISFSVNEENIWNGGLFGFEGSILTIPFQLAGILFIYKMYKNSGSEKKDISEKMENN